MNRKYIFHKVISTGFGSGYSPVAPGTAGTLFAVIVWLVIAHFVVSPSTLFWITVVLTVVFMILGVWTSGVVEAFWGEDPSRVVVDEMVGVWIPLLAVCDANLYYTLAAFIGFRFFDIVKPLGIRSMEKLKGGWGIMMDDVLAGFYTLVLILLAKWLIG